uniref:Uncharacterized protein n=1 Tax=uncultured marine group II/III euryarchaeote KM3_203_F09 TaxID=1456423 RepID=A0A075GUG2_9EURY|nr:hypothetical protein [uncultured marine group II/III euryarchaeote KM3_203_F09]
MQGRRRLGERASRGHLCLAQGACARAERLVRSDDGRLQGHSASKGGSLACCDLTDVSALAGCSRLATLNLSECTGVTDISAVAACTNLRLELRECTGVTDVSALGRCPNLGDLDLSRCYGLTELAGCTTLRTLTLENSFLIKDLSALEGCVNLEELDLTHCQSVTAVSPLACVHREALDLSHLHAVTDGSPLRARTCTRSAAGASPCATSQRWRSLDRRKAGVTDVSARRARAWARSSARRTATTGFRRCRGPAWPSLTRDGEDGHARTPIRHFWLRFWGVPTAVQRPEQVPRPGPPAHRRRAGSGRLRSTHRNVTHLYT